MTASYPPFVNAHGLLDKFFAEIKKAAVPAKFTTDFLKTTLGLKSSSYQAMPSFLKRLGFLDSANVPTESYKLLKDPEQAGIIMAQRIKGSYQELFAANESANELKRENLISKLTSILGTQKDDKTVICVAATFIALCKMADFKGSNKKKNTTTAVESKDSLESMTPIHPVKFGLSYTINLNLPATTDIEVFNAIFRSLKEHLLQEK